MLHTCEEEYLIISICSIHSFSVLNSMHHISEVPNVTSTLYLMIVVVAFSAQNREFEIKTFY